MRTLSAFLFFLFLASASHAESIQCPKAIGYHDDTPLVLKATEIMADIYEKLNCKIDLIYLPTKRSLIHFNNGLIDGEFYRFPEIEEKYTHSFVRSEIPLATVKTGIWGHPDLKPDDKPIGFVEGHAWQEQYVLGHPTMRFIGYKNDEELIKAYNLGHISAFLSTNLYAGYLYLDKQVHDKPVPLVVVTEHPFYHYLDKKYAPFMKQFSKALKKHNPFLDLVSNL